MICPQCSREFYFLATEASLEAGRCHRCGYLGDVEMPSYDAYHQDLYLDANHHRTCRTDPQMKWILDRMQIKESDRVLDLGCGVGDYVAEMSQLSKSVTGYDLNTSEAKKKHPLCQFQDLDLSKSLPFQDNSIDKIICVQAVEHLPNWNQFLRECARILIRGGMIVLTTANKEFLLHQFHHDKTHLIEWTIQEYDVLLSAYFKKVSLKYDCSMFKYYPFNIILRYLFRPDLTFIGTK